MCDRVVRRFAGPETLRVKITEENDARKSNEHSGAPQNAMVAARPSNRKFLKKKSSNRKGEPAKNESRRSESDDKQFKFKCHRCREIGHKAKDCKNRRQSANRTEDVNFYAVTCAYKSSSKDTSDRDKLVYRQRLFVTYVPGFK